MDIGERLKWRVGGTVEVIWEVVGGARVRGRGWNGALA